LIRYGAQAQSVLLFFSISWSKGLFFILKEFGGERKGVCGPDSEADLFDTSQVKKC
jgi:hypothetical protein